MIISTNAVSAAFSGNTNAIAWPAAAVQSDATIPARISVLRAMLCTSIQFGHLGRDLGRKTDSMDRISLLQAAYRGAHF